MITAEEFKKKEKERFARRKASARKKPEEIRLIVPPSKYPTKLHKKLAKLEKQYDRFIHCPIKLARILKQGISLDERIKKLERSKKL